MDIDLIIIIFFLATTLVIGLYTSKGIQTFKEYAVGNRKLSTVVITVSMIATTYGGGNLTYKINDYLLKGWYMLIRDLTGPFSFYLASRFIIIRMKEFLGDMSIAESMGKLYGQSVRVITAILGIIMAISLTIAQFKVGLGISRILFPQFQEYYICSTIVFALIVTIYSTFGGARAVAWTDVYQFFLFSICFPVIIFASLYYGQDISKNWQGFIEIPQFNFSRVFTWNHALMTAWATFIWHAIFPFDPARVQRIYMSSSIQQARKVFSYSATIRIVIPILFFSIVGALYIGGHTIPDNQGILEYILKCTYFPGIKGLIATSVIALLMSTADSNLHVASVLCVYDIFPFVFDSTNRPYKVSLKIVRITSMCIGIISLCFVLHTNSILQLINKARLFYTPVVTIPLIVACFGFKPSSAAVLGTMGINTMITGYQIYIQKKIDQPTIFISLLSSTFILLIMHHILPKKPGTGWIGIPDDSPVVLQNQETKRWWLRRIRDIHAFFTKSYWSDIFPKSTATFVVLGIYLIIYSAISLFYIQKSYVLPYIYWYMVIMAIGTIVTVYPAFHTYKKVRSSFLHILWPILLYLVLFVSSVSFVKLSYYNPIVYALMISNIALSSILLSFPITIIMLSMVLCTYRWIAPYYSLIGSHNATIVEWSFAAVIVSSILIGCVVYHYVRNTSNLKCSIMELEKRYEGNTALALIHNQANWNRLDPTYSGKVLQDIADSLDPYVDNLVIQQHQEKLYVFSKSLLKRAKEERTLTLDPKSIYKVDIENLILKSYETVKKLDIPIQLLLKKQTKEKYLLTESTTFERLLTINFLNLCKSKYAIDSIVSLSISDTLLYYPFPKPHQVSIHSTTEKQVTVPILSALAFAISTNTDKPNIAPTYTVIDDIDACCLPKAINNLYKEESKQIVQAHGGYIQTIETETGLTCLYILPIDGKNVMQFKRYHTDDLFDKIAENYASLTQEKELISLLVSKTTLTKKTVKETIQFIKKAHGNTLRKSGAPYYTHPMGVAKIALEATNNSETILAALLHDVVEDTMVTLEKIELLYGIKVAYIVDMVTHYNTNGYRWKLENRNHQKILDQCTEIRVIHVKLADRLHNLHTIAIRNPEDQIRIAKETLEFYIPWAKKHNLMAWASEMEEICTRILATYDR